MEFYNALNIVPQKRAAVMIPLVYILPICDNCAASLSNICDSQRSYVNVAMSKSVHRIQPASNEHSFWMFECFSFDR